MENAKEKAVAVRAYSNGKAEKSFETSATSYYTITFVGLPGAHDLHQPRRSPASFSRTIYSRPSAEKRKPGPCRPAVQERPGVKGLSRHMLPVVRYSTIPLTPGLISPRCSHQGVGENDTLCIYRKEVSIKMGVRPLN